MGIIFDIHSAKLYESWQNSQKGMAMDQFMHRQIPMLLAPLNSEKILDIGCGSGKHLLFLKKLGLDISGIDASPHMINLAEKRLGNGCALKTGLAEELPFEDNEFDLAVFINTLEFLDDPITALKEAGRVAKRKIFIGVLNSCSWNCIYGKVYGIFANTFFRHMRPYNLWELKNFARKTFGSAPVQWQSEMMPPALFNRVAGYVSDRLVLQSWPFCSFLGFSITIEYKFKTDNLPLKLRIKKTEQSMAGGVTTIGNLKVNRDKRS
jgi:ubiquinone/menaquinone biosynthesis C-methylase UbiE